MYYDRLRKQMRARKALRTSPARGSDVRDHIAPVYLPLHEAVKAGKFTTYNLPGGRGSGKSSFVALEIIDGMREDPTASAIVFRRYANTLRDSVFSQVQWAIDVLGLSDLWKASTSPMQFTYVPTGQQILFRGLDDTQKLKSIRPRHGYFRFIWFEEFSEIPGPRTVRSILQSVQRGGDSFTVFNSFNPPQSRNNWANTYVLRTDERTTTFRTDYRAMPPEWLGESFILEAEALKAINETAFRHEYLGEATGTGGEVFPTLEARTITDEEIAAMGYFYNGLDFGFATDPAAFIRLSYDARTRTVALIDEIYAHGMSNAALADAIKAKPYYTSPVYRVGFTERITVTCDSAEPKSIADLRRMDLNAVACSKWPGSVNYGIKWLQSRHIIIDPQRTPRAWEEFSQYEYAQTKDGEFLAEVPDRDNHTIDATRYALDRLIKNGAESA